ncbi:unnamed protein product [Notodromas monacha]|uniref:Chimerin 2 n=2 Tax=Notodromas monacha TaxID=399045 RepID=A0A7R9BZ36_9CRUS|nr:unnamed protein product [Notodromas monacha]CAG0924452.1 unnamed protein product [Notodromas monacha]
MARSESLSSDDSLRHQFPSDLWKDYLFNLQSQAPLPLPIYSRREIVGRPKPMQYGREFHGSIGRDEAEMLLKNKEGAYLVRESQSAVGSYALSMWVNGAIKHYMLYYDGKSHFLREDKKYDTLRDLVADGLIFMFLEARASDYIERMFREASYASSPFVTLQAKKREFSLRRTLKNHKVVDWRRSSEVDIQSYEKQHTFQTQTFRRFHWCDLCGNFLWGVVAQGVKCGDCDFVAHERCSKRVPATCSPEMKHLRGVYGADLTGVCKAMNRCPPFVVDLCIEEIEARGLHIEGLYRVSPSSDELDTLRFTLDQGKCLWMIFVPFEESGIPYSLEKDMYLNMEATNLAIYPDIHVICGVLKLFFRLLPIPLIPYDSYRDVIASVQNNITEKAKLKSLKTAIQNIPPAHYSTLKAFMVHLARVAARSQVNRMTAENLALILAPSLLRSPHISQPPSPCAKRGSDAAKDVPTFLSNPMETIPFERSVIELLIVYQREMFDA